MPRIAYDLRWINRDPGGITTYALNLLDALVRQKSEFSFSAIALPEGRELSARYLARRIEGLEFFATDMSPFDPRSHWFLPRHLERATFSIFHSPNYLGFLRRTKLRTVVTVHDLIAYLHPQGQPRAKAVRYRPMFVCAMRRSLAVADAIVADSQATKDEVRQAFPRQTRKVHVAGAAVNPVFHERQSHETLESVRQRFGITSRLVLYVGRRDPNKNIISLIRAVALLRQKGLDLTLLVCGRPDPRYPEPEQAVRELGLGSVVLFPGFVETRDLRTLYQTADILAYPSSHEGFGLPPLEAMASGTPVVCSHRASLPEVVGEAAVFVEPEDPASIASGIHRILTDASLRDDLIAKGRERARLFSWDTIAARVFDIYRGLLR